MKNSKFEQNVFLLFTILLPIFIWHTAQGYDSLHYPLDEHYSESEREYFDLSYVFDDDAIFWPNQRYNKFHLLRDVGPTVNVIPVGNYRYSFATYSFCMSEHGGTHLDAPFHFNKFGWKLAEIPLDHLVDIPAVLVDVEKNVFALEHPDEFFLEVEHLLEHEKKFGRIPPGSVIFARFGWGKFWPDKQRYLGWDNSTGELTFHFPGLSGNAASWLVRERKIFGYGSDTAAADAAVNTQGNNVVHIILLENQVYIIENLANLDNLLRKTRPNDLHGSKRYCKDLRAFIHPIKTLGTGGPANIVAHCRKW